MPIDIDDIIAKRDTNTVKKLTPKFFSKDLTGSGKASGIINKNLNPSFLPIAGTLHPSETFDAKTSSRSGAMKTQVIPLSPVLKRIYENYNITNNYNDNDISQMFHVYSQLDKDNNYNIDIYYNIIPQGLILYTEDLDKGGTQKTLYVNYREELHVIDHNKSENNTSMSWHYAPGENAIERLNTLLTTLGINTTVNTNAFQEWIDNYSVYDAIVKQAALWEPTAIQPLICNMLKDVLKDIETNIANNEEHKNIHIIANLSKQLRFLETYEIPLDIYKEIFLTINNNCSDQEIIQTLSNQNINLLINNALNHLQQIKSQLPTPSLPQNISDKFSQQQKDAITTEEPLVMLQAGAGTGKSTTILGRIDNLINSGIDPKDITVLSFTNAAADHISELNPNIGSMTIARMIHDTYIENYKHHDLSSIDTIVNSLDIYFTNNQTANTFRNLLVDIIKPEPGAYTQLNNFIEANFDEVIDILDKLQQTTLELEIIIAYQRINDMIEPEHVQSKYLIIDEVQDNSVFEFIYILKYVAKHKENLYIVGDPSQTLYEFRSANPKALNALEASNIFATFKLTTNYRSNQEILDFANIHLADIEANQYAKIQLQSNNLKPITAESFQEKVKLIEQDIPKISLAEDALPSILKTQTEFYIKECLDRKEQIAFLAYTRKQVSIIENTLYEMYPDKKIVNIVSKQTYPTTVFSTFIKKFWDMVTKIEPVNAPFVITDLMQKNTKSLTHNSAMATQIINKMVSEWWVSNQRSINTWLNAVNSKTMTKNQYFNKLQKSILDFEIRHNVVKASVLNSKSDQEDKEQSTKNADFVVSTIHGVKGLEFENVILYMKYDANAEEDVKRMQYVALTRAKNSELILPYSTSPKTGIKLDYDNIIRTLSENDKVQNNNNTCS